MPLRKRAFPRTHEELHKFKHDDTIGIEAKLHLIPWALKSATKSAFALCIAKYYKTKNKILSRFFRIKNSENSVLKIFIRISGGLGDTLMYAMAIKELYKYIGCDWRLDIAVLANNRRSMNLLAFSGYNFETNFFDRREQIRDGTSYDAVMLIDRFFDIKYLDYNRISLLSEKFLYFCEQARKFHVEHRYMTINAPRYHTLVQRLSELTGQKRFQQPDPYGMLGIDQSTKWFLNLPDQYYARSEKSETIRSVLASRYITLQCGVNFDEPTSRATRVWPQKHYEDFLEKFHKKFPDIKVIQLGYACKDNQQMNGVDINLSGKTSLEEVAVILKHSIFHVDGECGLVHLKHALNGRSIVMFGPTSDKVFGYNENINLRGDGCDGWCEWLTAKWNTRCPRGLSEAPCMASITPDMVLNATEQMINNLRKYSYQYYTDKVGDIVGFIEAHVSDPNATIVDVFDKTEWDLALNLRKRSANITVFRNDYKYYSFEFARTKGVSAEYGCLYNLAMHDDSCDVVIWQNGDKVPQHSFYAFKELMRILRPGGYLIISGVDFPDDIAEQFGIEGCKVDTYVLSKKVAN